MPTRLFSYPFSLYFSIFYTIIISRSFVKQWYWCGDVHIFKVLRMLEMMKHSEDALMTCNLMTFGTAFKWIALKSSIQILLYPLKECNLLCNCIWKVKSKDNYSTFSWFQNLINGTLICICTYMHQQHAYNIHSEYYHFFAVLLFLKERKIHPTRKESCMYITLNEKNI